VVAKPSTNHLEVVMKSVQDSLVSTQHGFSCYISVIL